jgi:DNA-binding CsgD family transcriptional regulator
MSRLTPREREVARLLAQGKRQTVIAQVLCISPLTVRNHVKSARLKVGAVSSFDLALQIALEDSTKQG